jgi:cysteine desulfurase
VAAAVGCQPGEVVFTSGATEAAMVLAQRPEGHGVWVEPTAHDCLWSHVAYQGAGPGQTLAMGYANNETGLITPPPAKVDGLWTLPGGVAGGAGWLMLDLVQAVGKVPVAFGWTGADLALVSAHKFGGPKGVGALIVRQGLEVGPWIVGGGQEMGRRSGTENLAGIAGMGAAAEAAARDLANGLWDAVGTRRDALEARLEDAAGDLILVGRDRERLPNTTCLIAPGWKGETQVMQMDLAGFAVSAGSACSSGKVRPSRVLKAMGYDDRAAQSAIRVSIGPATGLDEVMRFAEAWLDARARQASRAA